MQSQSQRGGGALDDVCTTRGEARRVPRRSPRDPSRVRTSLHAACACGTRGGLNLRHTLLARVAWGDEGHDVRTLVARRRGREAAVTVPAAAGEGGAEIAATRLPRSPPLVITSRHLAPAPRRGYGSRTARRSSWRSRVARSRDPARRRCPRGRSRCGTDRAPRRWGVSPGRARARSGGMEGTTPSRRRSGCCRCPCPCCDRTTRQSSACSAADTGGRASPSSPRRVATRGCCHRGLGSRRIPPALRPRRARARRWRGLAESASRSASRATRSSRRANRERRGFPRTVRRSAHPERPMPGGAGRILHTPVAPRAQGPEPARARSASDLPVALGHPLAHAGGRVLGDV